MNYKEALEYIHKISSLGSRPGLSRITELLCKIGNPEKNLKFIQVAGTNGKGSVSSMLSEILVSAGYKVGLYTSPFIISFNERIRVGGENIPDEKLAKITEFVKVKADQMADHPTEFELITAIGLECFKRENCDIVILEAGMGGRYDATNAVENTILSIITGVSLDHTDYLGDTIEKIASEKAGIIKNKAPVIFGGKDRVAESVIREEAKKQGSPFIKTDIDSLKNIEITRLGTKFSYKNYKNINLSLIGSYQPFNAAVVLEATEILNEIGFNVSEDNIRVALKKVKWAARMEKISEEPLIYYDGGHNREGVEAAVESAKTIFGEEKVYVISGVMKDKEYEFISHKLSTIAKKVFTITPNNPRSLDAKEYAKCFSVEAEGYETIEEGVKEALNLSKETNTPIFISGSLYMYSDIVSAVEKYK